MYNKGVPVEDLYPDDRFCGLTIIGEMPGVAEVKARTVFVGKSGQILEGLIKQLALTDPIHITNAVKCGLRGGAKPNKADMKTAVECCRELTLANLEYLETNTVLCLGGTALHAMTELTGIEKYRGCCWEPDKYPWITTCSIHPAGLLHQDARRIWIELLRDDLHKAYRLAKGQEELWLPIVQAFNPRDESLDEFLQCLEEAFEERGPLAIDVETDDIDALTCNLRTIGVAFEDKGYSIPWWEAYPEYWPSEAVEKVRTLFLKIFDTCDMHLVFQNKIFDVPVLERHFYGDGVIQ